MRLKTKRKGLITVVLIIILLIGFYLFYREGSLPVNKANRTPKIFVIKPGDGLDQIATNLKDDDLIRSKLVFFAIVKFLQIEKNIEAGDFRLYQSMSAEEIARNLTHGTLDVWITVIEGLRKEEIAEIFTKSFNIPGIEFINKANEGYLFPDTYLIPREASADAVIKIMTDNFNRRVTPELQDKFNEVDLTTEQAIILASIVEREAKFAEDRQSVASIFLRRMSEGIPLQADATVQYALGYQEDEKTWWKKNLTLDDLEFNSPYNTYLNPGLPPAPICNPGLASLEAVANANTNTPYLFYISDKSGHMHYGRDLDEHNSNIEKYLR
jgi:UPF0755 protein